MKIQARALLVLAVAVTLAVPVVGHARPRTRKAKEAANIDRELVQVMHLRDRGDLVDAMVMVQAVIGTHPESISAHRLYQELAVLSRRNGRLVEAEYRFYMEAAPEDPVRRLLHASAALTSSVVDGSDPEAKRDIARTLAATQGSEELRSAAHMIEADLNHVTGNPAGVMEHLRLSLEADPNNYAVRADLVAVLAGQGEWDEAAEHCFRLLDEAPWRAMACALLVPAKSGADGASPELQDQLATRLEKAEQKHPDDVVVLQSLEWVYAFVEERRESKRLRDRLAELDPDWKPPLERNPYLEALPGGELQGVEIALIEKVQELKDQTEHDAWARVRGLQDMQETLPAVPRIQAWFFRELAYALRAPDVLDRDASRAAVRQAMEAQPEDPGALNEWAYMSAMDKVDLPEALVVVDRALELILGKPFDPVEIEPGRRFSDHEIDRAESVGAYVDTRGWVLYQLGRHEEAVRELQLAALLTTDGTVQGHLGRARYAVGNDRGAFEHLLRALAMGTEDEDEVHDLAVHLYEKLHVAPGGLDALVIEMRRQLREELSLARDAFDLESLLDLDAGGPFGPPGSEGSELDNPTVGSRAHHPLLGRPAPPFSMTTLDGERVTSESLRGKVVVVDFWATWCGPCVEAMPMMVSLSQAFEDEDVQFVALSLDDSERAVRSWWKSDDASMHVGMAESGVSDSFGVEGIPATFLLDRDGMIAGYHAGFDPSMLETLTEELVLLLAR